MEKLTLKEIAGYNLNNEDLENEIFKELPDNPQYLVSNLGRIRSKRQEVKGRYGCVQIKKEKILKQSLQNGYFIVGLTKDKKLKTFRVSRLIADAWIENLDNKPQVNHINGIKEDNRIENLEWCTAKENIHHAWTTKLSNKQKSFLELQKRLSEINPYLNSGIEVFTPVGIGKVKIGFSGYEIIYENGKQEKLIKSLRKWKKDFKLIVNSLSMLTKPIFHNGVEIIPIVEINKIHTLEFKDGLFNDYVSDGWHVEWLPKLITDKLFEWHFDIHSLIERGLAIDKSKI